MKDCKWITEKSREASANKTYYFKRDFELEAIKDAKIEISAQARYKLFINGSFVCCGPC